MEWEEKEDKGKKKEKEVQKLDEVGGCGLRFDLSAETQPLLPKSAELFELRRKRVFRLSSSEFLGSVTFR